MTQRKVQDAHDHETYINSYAAIEQVIKADAMLSRQIQEEEQNYFKEHIKQIKIKDPMSIRLMK